MMGEQGPLLHDSKEREDPHTFKRGRKTLSRRKSQPQENIRDTRRKDIRVMFAKGDVNQNSAIRSKTGKKRERGQQKHA